MNRIFSYVVVLIFGLAVLWGCSSGSRSAGASSPVTLTGVILYPDTTIADDRPIHVKLNPGPDTLRVTNGQFTISAPFTGEYQLLMSYPRRIFFPPLTISLQSGANRISFMIPREDDIDPVTAGREGERAGEETRVIIIRP
jgi:hypothetical protein